jgi:hypothetical protein
MYVSSDYTSTVECYGLEQCWETGRGAWISHRRLSICQGRFGIRLRLYEPDADRTWSPTCQRSRECFSSGFLTASRSRVQPVPHNATHLQEPTNSCALILCFGVGMVLFSNNQSSSIQTLTETRQPSGAFCADS